MLQKRLAQTIAAMAGAGCLGMLVAFLICGKIEDRYVDFGSVLSFRREMPESSSITQAERDGIRNKIYAGGCAGILIGLSLPVWPLRRKF